MDSILTPEVVSVLTGGIGAALIFLVGKFVKSAVARAVIAKVLEKGLPLAYQAAEAHAARTPGTLDDKLALALKFLADYVSAHDVSLTGNQLAQAKVVFSALHAQSVAAPTPVAVK